MTIYIAAPFFNKPQVELVECIEQAIAKHGHRYYSPRTDSGSAAFTPQDRQNPAKWKEVFDSNINGMERSGLILAVVEYKVPPDTVLGIMKGAWSEIMHERFGWFCPDDHLTRMEIPDTGVAFEMGYANAMQLPLVLFHSTKTPNKLNLMLSHAGRGLITGLEDLNIFLEGGDRHTINKYGSHTERIFDWSMAKGYYGDII